MGAGVGRGVAFDVGTVTILVGLGVGRGRGRTELDACLLVLLLPFLVVLGGVFPFLLDLLAGSFPFAASLNGSNCAHDDAENIPSTRDSANSKRHRDRIRTADAGRTDRSEVPGISGEGILNLVYADNGYSSCITCRLLIKGTAGVLYRTCFIPARCNFGTLSLCQALSVSFCKKVLSVES